MDMPCRGLWVPKAVCCVQEFLHGFCAGWAKSFIPWLLKGAAPIFGGVGSNLTAVCQRKALGLQLLWRSDRLP